MIRATRGATLTPREHQVVFCLLFGRSCRETAALLGIGLKTVYTYRQNAMAKCGARNAMHLAILLLGPA